MCEDPRYEPYPDMSEGRRGLRCPTCTSAIGLATQVVRDLMDDDRWSGCNEEFRWWLIDVDQDCQNALDTALSKEAMLKDAWIHQPMVQYHKDCKNLAQKVSYCMEAFRARDKQWNASLRRAGGGFLTQEETARLTLERYEVRQESSYKDDGALFEEEEMILSRAAQMGIARRSSAPFYWSP
ncbi:hypothetical protein JX265_003925 [Neoarthrinium moseri]|uniref:Uncharacterized protein n=1 Tax=Neoarthrinium moseri TaxID=1658444 RepID=A0A9Q0ASM4_9PEZI|nr:uncharacterized protein JN550_006679 [Neoarthrinium moseri]KAI1853742.1 hypothetical protein JX266_001726 [Neoarthrinium moseri]KAI1867872.1 hypothetical protein JN550_006679 [Neoarthrinium moseri]KAI1876399.1 hypothetical protein JX265_003925 [Neoarthrinium moseri]